MTACVCVVYVCVWCVLCVCVCVCVCVMLTDRSQDTWIRCSDRSCNACHWLTIRSLSLVEQVKGLATRSLSWVEQVKGLAMRSPCSSGLTGLALLTSRPRRGSEAAGVSVNVYRIRLDAAVNLQLVPAAPLWLLGPGLGAIVMWPFTFSGQGDTHMGIRTHALAHLRCLFCTHTHTHRRSY